MPVPFWSCRRCSLLILHRPHEWKMPTAFCSRRYSFLLDRHRPHEDERSLLHSVRVDIVLLSSLPTTATTRRRKMPDALYSCCRHSLLHQPHEDGRGLSVLFVLHSFSFRSPPTTRRWMKPLPFCPCRRRSPFFSCAYTFLWVQHHTRTDVRRRRIAVACVYVSFGPAPARSERM